MRREINSDFDMPEETMEAGSIHSARYVLSVIIFILIAIGLIYHFSGYQYPSWKGMSGGTYNNIVPITDAELSDIIESAKGSPDEKMVNQAELNTIVQDGSGANGGQVVSEQELNEILKSSNN